MHIDAVGEHAEGFRPQLELGLLRVRCTRPKEGALLEPFGHQPHARAIPVEHLDECSALIGKDKERAAARVLLEPVGHQRVQRVDARPHVTRVQRDEDLQTAREA